MRYIFIFLLSLSLQAQEANFSSLILDKELVITANSVLREELITVDVTKPGEMIETLSRTITVLNESGNNNLNAYLYYDDQTVIKNIALVIYDKFGIEIEKFKRNDFKDVSAADGFSLYNDDRILYAEYVPKSYPYTVTFTTKVKTKTTAFLPRWFPLEGYAASTEKSVYKLIFNPANKPKYQATNIEGYDIVIEETDTDITCTAKLLPGLLYEEHAPEFASFAPQVMFALESFILKGVKGNGTTWSEFGSWMDAQLLEGTEVLPEATILEVNNLVSAEMTDIEKARVVYQYLQDKVRYISVQIGIGGWKPMLASDVDRLSYGDCKALTNYTKALLNAVDVPSYYTVLYSGNGQRDFTEDLVAMQGNHVMLAIPQGEEFVWLECTSQDIPFGHVPDNNDDRDVLVVTENGGKIVHTKRYEAKDNLQENEAEIRILESGEIEATFNRKSSGLQYDNVYWLALEDKKGQQRYYKEKWDYINGIQIKDLTLDNDRINVIFSETLKVNSANYTSFAGTDMLFSLNVFNQLNYIPPRIMDRKRELEISTGFMDNDSYTIYIPQGYKIESLPSKKEIKSSFGSYIAEVKKDEEGAFVYKRTLVMNKGIYPAEQYDDYRSFLKKIAKYDTTKILLTKK